ncbi:MAG TPA: hypothetical protein VF625_10580 [Longimicrobium sp.]|jgi:hypothetical protein
MSSYPKLIDVSADRLAEGAIFVSVVAEVSNSATSKLTASHRLDKTGTRLLVQLDQAATKSTGFSTQVTGKKRVDVKVSQSEMDIDGIKHVDVYGGDPSDAKRVTLS